MDFPQPCQVTRQIRSFTFGNPSSACPPPSTHPPVRQSANPSTRPPVRPLSAPVRSSVQCARPRPLIHPSARPPIVRPRPLVRPVCPPPSAHPPVRPLVRLLIRSEPSSACAPVRPPVRPSAHPVRPVRLISSWSLAYKFLAVEVERALCLSVSQDCGFSLEDPLRETHCTGGHPALVQGHGIVLEYYVVLCLVESAS